MTRIEDVWGDIDIGVEIPAIGIPGPTDWRPWVALSQAQYNAMQPEDFHPDILYIVGATRIYQGETNVFPPPFTGGVVNVTDAWTSGGNPSIDIPASTPGNLLILHSAGTGSGAASAGATDSAGQTWKPIARVGGASQTSAIDALYIEGSASVTRVTLNTANSATRCLRVIEVSGIATQDALSNWGAGVGGAVAYFPVTVTPNDVSFLYAGLGRLQGSIATSTITERPAMPWTNLDDMVGPPDVPVTLHHVSAFGAHGLPGVAVGTAWRFSAVANSNSSFIAAFRVADTPSPR